MQDGMRTQGRKAPASLVLLVAGLFALGAMFLPSARFAASARAQVVDTAPMKKAKDTRRVDITADAMEIQDDRNTAIFTGNVRAIRGNSTLYADRLVVHYRKVKKPDGGEKTEVTDFVATGNVRIVDEQQTITGREARMDVQKDLLWVTGNVTVKTRTATVRGQKLFANLKTGVSRMEAGGKGRVRGIFSE
jgi:lipopolysaccharide export system protein LptA